MSNKKILYVDNASNIKIGLISLPMDFRDDKEKIEYKIVTNYLRARRKIGSERYDAVIVRDLEIPQTPPKRDPLKTSYKETEPLALNWLPIENSLNFLRLSRDMGIPRIAILNSNSSDKLIRILKEEELAYIITEGRNKLSMDIHDALRDILKIRG